MNFVKLDDEHQTALVSYVVWNREGHDAARKHCLQELDEDETRTEHIETTYPALVTFAYVDGYDFLRETAHTLGEITRALGKLDIENTGCGDPYAHDCGRPNCPTSDSYKPTRK